MEEPLGAQASIAAIVSQFAAKQERAPHEAEAIAKILSTNWITTLEHWQMLDSEAKKELGLPAVLVAHLDSLSGPSQPPGILPTLLAALPPSHTPARALTRFGYCYFLLLRGKTYFWLAERSYEFADTDRVSTLLGRVEGNATLRDATGSIVAPDMLLTSVLPTSTRLVVGENVYLTRPFSSWKAVDHWLSSIGLPHYRQIFEEEGVDDFLVLPFLRLSSLDDMQITAGEDKRTISLAVQALQDCLPGDLVGLWMRHLGYPYYMEKFVKHQIWPQLLLVLKEEDLRLIGIKTNDVPVLWELIRSYQQFSSVEASYLWLRSHGFENYAFQFVRYNIPFYALPLVNFFIIGEMAVLGDNQELLRALQALKDSPAYNVKAIAFWLRDLELSNYTQTFAKNLMVNFIESLTILTDHTINRLVPSVIPDRNKLKTAVREMKEFRFYYMATAALLEEPIMQKHAQLFAEHGVSIDVLPLLTDTHIQEMGVMDPADRVKILEALKKLRELPVVDKNSRMIGASTGKKFGSQTPGTAKDPPVLSLTTSPTSLPALDMKMSGIPGLSTSPSALGSLSPLGATSLDLRVPADMKLTAKSPKRKPAKK